MLKAKLQYVFNVFSCNVRYRNTCVNSVYNYITFDFYSTIIVGEAGTVLSYLTNNQSSCSGVKELSSRSYLAMLFIPVTGYKNTVNLSGLYGLD